MLWSCCSHFASAESPRNTPSNDLTRLSKSKCSYRKTTALTGSAFRCSKMADKRYKTAQDLLAAGSKRTATSASRLWSRRAPKPENMNSGCGATRCSPCMIKTKTDNFQKRKLGVLRSRSSESMRSTSNITSEIVQRMALFHNQSSRLTLSKICSGGSVN